MKKIPNENELSIKTERNSEDIELILSLLEVIPGEIKGLLKKAQPEKLTIPPEKNGQSSRSWLIYEVAQTFGGIRSKKCCVLIIQL